MHAASFIYSFIHESIDSKSLTFIYTGFIHSCMVDSFIYSTRNTVSILISFIVCVATSTSVGIKSLLCVRSSIYVAHRLAPCVDSSKSVTWIYLRRQYTASDWVL